MYPHHISQAAEVGLLLAGASACVLFVQSISTTWSAEVTASVVRPWLASWAAELSACVELLAVSGAAVTEGAPHARHSSLHGAFMLLRRDHPAAIVAQRAYNSGRARITEAEAACAAGLPTTGALPCGCGGRGVRVQYLDVDDEPYRRPGDTERLWVGAATAREARAHARARRRRPPTRRPPLLFFLAVFSPGAA